MKQLRVSVVALLGIAIFAGDASAQLGARDAWVLPQGMARAAAGGDYSQFDSRFGPDSLAAWGNLLRPLDALGLTPPATLRTGLEGFFEATGGPVAGTDQLTFGAPDLRISGDSRVVPLGLGIGLLPRVEVGFMVPLYRAEVQVTRFAFPGGTIGLNPDPARNAAAFATIGAEYESLGREPFLPLAGSPLGEELARRVEERGDSLALPLTTAGADSLANLMLTGEFGLPPLDRHLTPWRIGDAEATVRVRLFSTMGDAAFPEEGSDGVHVRAMGEVGLRIPTGTEPDTIRLITATPTAGLSGWSGGVAADLFITQVGWLSAGASYSSRGATDVLRRVVDPARPLSSTEPPRTVRWTPPSELRIRISPRVRLERAISIGVEYEMLKRGESTFGGADGGASILNVPEATLQRFGGSIGFSSLIAYAAGDRVIPFDASIAYVVDLSGPDGEPERTALSVQGRIFQRLWGAR